MPSFGTSGFPASGGDYHVLPALYHVGARGCGATERQLGLKKNFAILLVEDTKGLVRRRSNVN